MGDIEYPGLAISYFSDAKNKDQAMRRIIGMRHPTFLIDGELTPKNEKLTQKYKSKFNITEDDLDNKYKEIQNKHQEQDGGVKKHKAKKSRKAKNQENLEK